jgi:hypothetical protein
MRKFSAVAVLGLAASFCGSAALAQGVNLAKSSDMSTLLSAQPPAELRVSREIAPSPLTVAAQPSVTLAPSETMTAPMAPGSGATIDIAMTPDTSMAVRGAPSGGIDLRPSGGFSTASGDDATSGVPALLGFNTTTSVTTSYSPDPSMTPNVTLGR